MSNGTTVAEIELRITKNKAELAELNREVPHIYAEDFRAKFRMDIDNLTKAIEIDEKLLEGTKNE